MLCTEIFFDLIFYNINRRNGGILHPDTNFFITETGTRRNRDRPRPGRSGRNGNDPTRGE